MSAEGVPVLSQQRDSLVVTNAVTRHVFGRRAVGIDGGYSVQDREVVAVLLGVEVERDQGIGP